MRTSTVRQRLLISNIVLSGKPPLKDSEYHPPYHTPLRTAALTSLTDSVKMILDCLTADQQIQIMSVQDRWGNTAIQWAERYRRHTDTERVLTEYQQRAERLQKQQEQSRLHKSVSGRLS